MNNESNQAYIWTHGGGSFDAFFASEEPPETAEKVPTFPNQLFFLGTEMYKEAKRDRYKPFKWLNGLSFVYELTQIDQNYCIVPIASEIHFAPMPKMMGPRPNWPGA